MPGRSDLGNHFIMWHVTIACKALVNLLRFIDVEACSASIKSGIGGLTLLVGIGLGCQSDIAEG